MEKMQQLQMPKDPLVQHEKLEDCILPNLSILTPINRVIICKALLEDNEAVLHILEKKNDLFQNINLSTVSKLKERFDCNSILIQNLIQSIIKMKKQTLNV